MYYEQVSENRFSPEIPLYSVRLDRSHSYDVPPPPRPRYEESEYEVCMYVCMKYEESMKRVRDFVADFAKAGKGFTEIR
jgi:hypothetical protein